MNLNKYEVATSLKDALTERKQFAQITSGSRQGTVGQLTDVRSRNFSHHEYLLRIEGRKAFWVNARFLQLLENYNGETLFKEEASSATFKDTMGRLIEVGHTILFPRGISGGSIEMVVGTVKRIGPSGSLYVRPFQIGGKTDCTAGEIRIGVPERAMVLDKETLNTVMMAKLTCGH